MIKKISKTIGVLILSICVLNYNVNALSSDDIYFENKHGVKFSKEEYDFVSEFYYDGYQEYMTMEDYLRLKDLDIMDKEVKSVVYEDDGIQTYTDVIHQSASKKLVMSYSCGTICSVTLKASWLTIANVRSYDLIGAYSPTANALELSGARMTYSGNAASYIEKNISEHGISTTFKLPSTDAKYNLILDFVVPSGTKVYGSYQHAKKEISLGNSRKYSFASSGYGKVFKFDSSVESYYDGMGGVNATVK